MSEQLTPGPAEPAHKEVEPVSALRASDPRSPQQSTASGALPSAQSGLEGVETSATRRLSLSKPPILTPEVSTSSTSLDTGSTSSGDTSHWRRTVSFVRRTERLTEAQQRVWDTRRDAYLVDVPRGAGGTLSVDPTWAFDAAATFGREAPIVVEIGTGQGENVVAAASASPEQNFLGVEVYTPGVARAMVRAEALDPGAGLANLRMAQVNAVDFLATGLPEGSVDELWVFFPDPWPKRGHHKRRMLNADFATLAARVLRPGGVLRIATDWPHYAEQIRETFDAADGFTNEAGSGNFAPRFDGRILTAFEARGIKAARPIADLTYRRVALGVD